MFPFKIPADFNKNFIILNSEAFKNDIDSSIYQQALYDLFETTDIVRHNFSKQEIEILHSQMGYLSGTLRDKVEALINFLCKKYENDKLEFKDRITSDDLSFLGRPMYNIGYIFDRYDGYSGAPNNNKILLFDSSNQFDNQKFQKFLDELGGYLAERLPADKIYLLEQLASNFKVTSPPQISEIFR